MKITIALITIVISFNSYACNQVIKAVYGPFFSVSFYQEYLSGFNENIEKLTGCKVSMKIEPTHEKFIMALVKGEAHMSLIPGFYYEALKPHGLLAIFETRKAFSNMLITNKGVLNNFDMKQLAGKRIMVQGEFSRGYIMLKQWLAQSDLSGQVEIDSGHRHDVIGLRLAKKQGSSGVISTAIFNRMPEAIKKNYVILKKSQPLKSLLVISEHSPASLKPAIEKSIKHLNYGEWGAITSARIYPQRVNDFKQQLDLLIKSQKK